MRKLPLAALVLALASAPLFAQGGRAPFTVAETRQGFATLQQAVDAIGGGAGTIRIAPGTYEQCAVQSAGRVAFVAEEFGAVTFDGVACDGKAALVLGGQEARVEGLIFQNIAVPDRNGAGIRLQSGNLIVRESLFRDSEQGILTANDPRGSIRIERSTFSGLGLCPEGGDCAHSLYIGDYGSLTVVRSRFERGRGGHYVKTRAPRVEIADSSFDDSDGRATNYMIDLSNGATGTIARNTFVQGRNKENYSALIFVGPEAQSNSSDGLTIADNDVSLAPGASATTFVVDRSGEGLTIENNRLGAQITRYARR
ncbi:MAG TPA: right-handed parallel beta-helix repeat-containing protein [Allosphingosinicella sp.]|nr:right-handed parallel beta-helix repeat-containing protein [Allosphingosinicella sp.]